MLKTKVNKTYNLIIRIAIILLAYGFLYYQLFIKKDLSQIRTQLEFSLSDRTNLFILGAVIVLMILNWGIESLKWKLLVDKIQPIRYRTSVKAVLSGLTISVITPNRIGEFFGRIFVLNSSNAIKGILVTVIGSMSQLLITLIAGGIGIVFYLRMTDFDFLSKYPISYFFIVAIGILSMLAMILLFFRFPLLTKIASKFVKKRWVKIRRTMQVFNLYHNKELLQVLSLSLLRFAIFSFQFYLLLLIFDLDISLGDAFINISITFLLITIIPSIALAEIGIRGSVSIFIFEQFFKHQPEVFSNLAVSVFAATTLLWLVNIVLPTIAGSLAIPSIKFIKKRKIK